MCLVDMGAVHLLNLAQLVRADEHRERTLACRVLLRLAPWHELLFCLLYFGLGNLAPEVLGNHTIRLLQGLRKRADVYPAVRVVIERLALWYRVGRAHVVNDSPDLHLGYLGPVAFGVHLAQMLRLEAELEGKDFELL